MTRIAAPARSRNSAETRAAILAAARRLFAAERYEQVGLRAVGEAARADPALIVRYFGGKEQLFAEVLASSEGFEGFLAGDRNDFGARVARALVLGEGRLGSLEGLLVAIRSVSSPRAPDLLCRSMEEHFVEPLAGWLGGHDRVARAKLILTYIAGVALTRATISPFDGASSSDETKHNLAKRLADGLQALVGDGAVADAAQPTLHKNRLIGSFFGLTFTIALFTNRTVRFTK